MAEQTPIPLDKGLIVELAPNAMHAALRLRPGMDIAQITDEVCVEHLKKAGIAERCIPRDLLADCVKLYHDDPLTEGKLELAGVPAVHGENGRLEWYEGMDPTRRIEDSAAGQVDHYNRSAFVTVAKDQAFARIHPPTDGTPGLDLRGAELPPNPGKPAAVNLAPSVACDNDGICRAAHPGVVLLEGQALRIDPLLAVPGSVDFSTGNIRFEGDVQIGGGVCDRFVVRATGNVEIKQVIEAAAIDVGGDLRALGGMAAKERGHVRVGGHLIARYLDNVVGTVTGNLEVEREIIGCELAVTGIVQSPKAALLGGILRCCDAIHLVRIGSMAAVTTIIDLGHVPAMEQNIAQQEQQRREGAEMLTQLQALIDAVGPSASPALLSRKIKLHAMDHQIELRIEMLRAQLEKQRKVDVHVAGLIGPGVTFICGSQVVTFLDQVRGPLHIARDEQADLTISMSNGPRQPLTDWPQVRAIRKQAPQEKVPQPV
ncbi:MAG: FapA family protein [Phycisphaeraceae bacterium]